MLSGLWNVIRASFNRRLALYEIVVVSLTLFGALPNPLTKLPFLAIFLVAGGLFMAIFTLNMLSKLRLVFSRKKEADIPIPVEIRELEKRIGSKIRRVKIRAELCNAFVRARSMVLGFELLERLSFDELLAVVAHELGHIKEKHGLIRVFAMFPLLLIPWYSWSRLTSPIFFTESLTYIIITVMLGISFLAYTVLVMIPINWYLEVRADRIAARFVGKESIKSALLALVSKENLLEPSEDHPSISERVKLIEKLRI